MQPKDFTILERRKHSKASEEYVHVEFQYEGNVLDWDIPIEYRRTGTHLAESSADDIAEYVADVYYKCAPDKWEHFVKEQELFWAEKPGSAITKSFFDVLARDFTWQSVKSDLPPNPNWARRVQDLKEMGYTIATRTAMQDLRTGQKGTHLLLVPLPRGGITGYETWTTEVRNQIIRLLGSRDAYEGKKVNKDSLLPDHKFPEIRWDENVRRSDLSKLTDDDILHDFQLLTNQRNLQKREVCRACSQTGQRGTPFGIEFFYEGSPQWEPSIPRRGADAEAGCVGCGWYDFEAWRIGLNEKLNSS